MKRIWSQCRKELAQFRRDRLTVALAILLPLATLILFGYAIRLETEQLTIAIQDFDISPLSRDYIEQIFATNQFKPTIGNATDPTTALDRGTATAAIIIPPDFDRQIRDRQPVSVQVIIDGTDVNNARIVQNSIRATTSAFLNSANLRSQAVPVQVETRLWFNPGRKESLYVVPGIYGVILWIYPSLLSAIAMAREKERGTMVQVYASSLSAMELLFGKGLAYFLVGIAEALCVMLLGSLLFGFGFAGDPTPLVAGTAVYLAASVLFGLLVGTRANNQNTAVQGVATIGFLTALLLSGFIYPLSNIPFPLSLISRIVPARYYIQLSRDAFVRGIGWVSVWWIIPVLMGVSLVLFSIARRLLGRMQLRD